MSDNRIYSVAVDSNGYKWFGTYYGLSVFDGTNWDVYTTNNSGLPDNHITCLTVDNNGNKWIGTLNGLAKLDGEKWTIFNTNNSKLPHNRINSVDIDKNDNKWISTMGGGLGVFDDINWTTYNVDNSDLTNNFVNIVSIDEYNNECDVLIKTYSLYQNYPNPFNPSTIIRYSIPAGNHIILIAYNTLGQVVAKLVDREQEPGYYEVTFDASHLPSGVCIYRLQAGEYVESRKMLYL